MPLWAEIFTSDSTDEGRRREGMEERNVKEDGGEREQG